jgi:hypothetical protein
MQSTRTKLGRPRSGDGDEAAGAEGAVEAKADAEAERDVAEPRRALDIRRHHAAAAVGAPPGRLVRGHHSLRLVAHQHEAHVSVVGSPR